MPNWLYEPYELTPIEYILKTYAYWLYIVRKIIVIITWRHRSFRNPNPIHGQQI